MTVTTLTVWKFETADGAEVALQTLGHLVSQGLIQVHDAATVSWPSDKKKPKTRQVDDLGAKGALSGSFWGLLFGVIFFVPLLGVAVGAAAGATAGLLSDTGIDDGFLRDVREKVTPGTSALFLMSSDAVTDRVKEAFVGQHPELIRTNLSHAEEDQLRSVFDEG